MSTDYHYLSEPITDIQIEDLGETSLIHIWVDGKQAGTLTVSAGVAHQLVRTLSDHDQQEAVRTTYGGKKLGTVVYENVRGLDPELTLVSEYGEPVKVKRIRTFAGGGKEE